MKFHSLRGQRALEKIGKLEIESERDARKKFQHRHFLAEPTPDRAELEPDRAGADDEQFFGALANISASVLLTIVLPVELRERQFDRHASGGDDDVLRFDFLRLAAVRLH